MEITLTTKQKHDLKIQHDTTRDGRVRDRIKAVILAGDGWSAATIAIFLLIHETTVRQHVEDYLSSCKLKPENGGSQSYLSPVQTQEVIQHLTDNTYHCTVQIIAYILENYNVLYSIPGINKWLHHNGFSYKKCKGIPHKFDEAKQQQFIAAYEVLKASCDKDESILFINAVHIIGAHADRLEATKISSGWIRKGQDKLIETTGSRTRLNIIGALNLLDIGATVIGDYETINSENIVNFFDKIRDSYPFEHKLHIILDGAGYHRSDLVKKSALLLNIELHYLPPYNPNLNPIERLWKVMNEKARNNVYTIGAHADRIRSKPDFKAAISNFFTVTLPQIAGELASRINDNFEVLRRAPPS